MNYLPHLAARVIDAPLMVERARLETILSVVGPRIGVETSGAPPGFESERETSGLAVTPNGIALIPIVGTLVKRAGAIDAASGLLSYAVIEEMILEATTDPAVGGILLDVDSPGGEVGGVFDLADLIREAREAKPIYAMTDDAFSAAYLLASAADRIYLSQTGGVGSVGVIAVHVDESERDAKEGRRFTTVFAGARKNDFSRHEPLSDAARSRLQTEVGRIYDLFVGAVARNRGMTEQSVRSTEAGLFFGADAVRIGLADQVGTLRDALAALVTALEAPGKTIIHAAATPPVSKNEEIAMETEDQVVDKAATTEEPAAPAAKPPETVKAPNVPKQEAQAQPVVPPKSADVVDFPDPKGQPRQNTPPVNASQQPAVLPSAEVIDLEKVRAEKGTQMRQEAAAIVELCALANQSALAGEFIAKGMDVNAVRRKLMALRTDGEEIHSQLMPGDGTRVRPEENLDANPVVIACHRLAKQSAAGE